jgi:CHAT domain-containing protein/tetratricopeptide (TPR) repeat protein
VSRRARWTGGAAFVLAFLTTPTAGAQPDDPSAEALARLEADLDHAQDLANRGRQRDAAQLLRETLARLRADPETGPEATARALLGLGYLETSLAEYDLVEQRLAEAERLLEGLDAPRLRVDLVSKQGTLAYFRGEPYEALRLREEAVRHAEALGDPALAALRRADVGMALIELHDYAGAILFFEQALADTDDVHTEMLATFGLGISQLELNRFAGAAESFERMARRAEESGKVREQGLAAGELGLVHHKRGDAELALEHLDRAIAICQQIGDRHNEAGWWQNKGMVRRDQGRFAEALVFYERAVELRRQLPGARGNPNLYKHIGQSRAGFGDDDSALELFDQALEGARAVDDHKVIWETERERARLFVRQRRFADAASSYLASLDAIESMRGSLRLESFKTDFFENKVAVFEEAIAFFLEHEEVGGVERAFEVSERARARAFLDSLVESRAQLHETLPDDVRQEETDLHRRISGLQARLRRATASPEDREALELAERSLDALHLRVRSERPRFEDLQGLAPTTVGDLRAVLHEGEVALAYFLSEPASHAWLVRHDGVEHRELAGRAAIQRAVEDAYVQLLDRSTAPDLGGLAALVLAPLEDAIAAVDSLLVVPSGALFYFPFEALPLGEGDGLLVDRLELAYWPSASTIVELRRRPTTTGPPRLFAVGDARYGDQRSFSTERSADLRALSALGALPHTRDEVLALRDRFGSSSTVLLGEEASESELKRSDLGRYSVVHLATHGFIDPTSPNRSGLVLSDESVETEESEPEDGLLQPREILRLRLAASLVTLSACQSALGELVTGEGMVSLARSFFYAGTDTVVASLWNVNDRAAAELMGRFYDALADGLPKAAALRRARLELREQSAYRHPYYWAPWILLGSGSDPVEVPRSRSLVPWAVLALALVGTAAAVRLLRRRG